MEAAIRQARAAAVAGRSARRGRGGSGTGRSWERPTTRWPIDRIPRRTPNCWPSSAPWSGLGRTDYPTPRCNVTLEPCAQCVGAIILAKVGRVIFGAYDQRCGMAGSVHDILRHPRVNHRPEVGRRACWPTSAAHCSRGSSGRAGPTAARRVDRGDGPRLGSCPLDRWPSG